MFTGPCTFPYPFDEQYIPDKLIRKCLKSTFQGSENYSRSQPEYFIIMLLYNELLVLHSCYTNVNHNSKTYKSNLKE